MIKRYHLGADPEALNRKTHIYAEVVGSRHLLPMCRWGYNSDEGTDFVIELGVKAYKGTCAICRRRRARKLPPVLP